MAKTTRHTKPATNARLANTISEPSSTPSQSHPRKRNTQRPVTESPAAPAAAARLRTAPSRQHQTLPRPGSKQALILSLLACQQGASLAEMMAATGWLPHTTRAALTGLRQRGCTIERSTRAEGGSTYRITNSAQAAADGETA
jgi:hypothetical protein